MLYIAIASRYIQHFDKATDGGQRLSWLSKILQVLRFRAREERFLSNLCCTVPPNWKVSESWCFGMCNMAPWPISHSPTAWPSPSDGGRYRKAVVKGLHERCSRVQHCVMKTKAKEKTHTHTHESMSVVGVKFYLQQPVSCFWCVHPRGVKKPAFRFWGSTSIGSMESMPCRWRSTSNWVVSPSSSGAGLTWWKMSRVQMRPGRLWRRKHSNGFASSSRYMASTKVNEKGLDENMTTYQD